MAWPPSNKFLVTALRGPAGAALDLVEEQQQSALVAEPAQPLEELRLAGVHPPVPLDRLHEDGGRIGVNEVREALEVVQLAKHEPGHERTESPLDGLLRGRAHPAEHPSVEPVLCANDLDAPALDARLPDAVKAEELDQRLVRLAAAVAEEDAPGPREPDQPAGELALIRIAEEVAHMDELSRLALDRRNPARVAVAERAHGDARRKVEIGPALVVPDRGAEPADERQRRPRVVPEDVGIVQFRGARADMRGELIHGRSPFRSPCP